jgi:hypothetical protein
MLREAHWLLTEAIDLTRTTLTSTILSKFVRGVLENGCYSL